MRHHQMMRTTLDIDEDVLAAVKSIARSESRTAGKVLSEVARKGLAPITKSQKRRSKDGIPLFNFPRKPGDIIVTSEMVKKLRDETE
jgi:hypothetical protein